MKIISIIAAGTFILAACNNEVKDAATTVKYSDLNSEGLKGKIAAVEESHYKTDSTGKMGEMDSCCTDKWQYDENGNYNHSTSQTNKGVLSSESTAERYDNGLWKGESIVKNGKPSSRMETQMDDKGQWTSATSYDSTGKMEYYYTGITQSDYGQVMSWKQYDKDSVFRQEGEGKFDKNLQTSFTIKDSTGKVKTSTTSRYNDKGEQTEVSNTTKMKDSTTTKVTKYTYDAHDDQGNWTQRTTWDDKGKATQITKRTYTYASKDPAKK